MYLKENPNFRLSYVGKNDHSQCARFIYRWFAVEKVSKLTWPSAQTIYTAGIYSPDCIQVLSNTSGCNAA